MNSNIRNNFIWPIVVLIVGGVALYYWERIPFITIFSSWHSFITDWLSTDITFTYAKLLVIAPLCILLIAPVAYIIAHSKLNSKVKLNLNISSELNTVDSINAPIFDEYDLRIIKCLIEKDGEWEDAETIASLISLPKLIVENSLSRLVKLDFAKDYLSMGHGACYKLSEIGTQYALNEKILTVKQLTQ